MINPINHYAFQNSPTVYDEEAMTALELVGRMGHKLNEVISAVNGYNVPKIVNVSPTGDETGELDRATIQGKLDKGYAVHLSAGEYYLNGPLIFRPGYMLRGDSQLNTVINCKKGFIDHFSTVSVDHVEIRDIRVKGPGEGIGIDISRKAAGVETGGRYAHFLNVYLTGFRTGVLMSGCWCTNFTHCRIEATGVCVEQGGSCNHVKYDHCIFNGPEEYGPSVGVKISAAGGAENYGITFDHCEFERHDQAINAYACVALNVNSIYTEGVGTVFQLDSCPGFMCAGGYVAYADRICNTARSNEAPVFAKCNGSIRDLYIRVSGGNFYAVSTDTNAPLEVCNITCVQDYDVGRNFVNAQCANSIWNGHDYHTIIEGVTNEADLRYSVNPFKATQGIVNYHLAAAKNKPGHAFKVQAVKIIPSENVTPTKDVTLRIQVDGDYNGSDTGAMVTIMEAQLKAGTKYVMGTPIEFTPVSEDYRFLIASSINAFGYRTTANDFASSFKGQIVYTIASGEMIL